MKRSSAAAAIAAIICLTAVTDAAAQLGKLKKAAGDKAAQAAGVSTKKTVTVDQIGLTVADLQALQKGIKAEVDAAPAILKQAEEDQKKLEKAQEQYSRDLDAYTKASDKYTKCRDKLVESEQPQEDALAKKGEAEAEKANMDDSEQAALEARAMRAQEAAAKVAAGTATAEDRKTLADFQQAMAGIGARGNAAAAASNELSTFKQGQAGRIKAKCGDEPKSPQMPGGGNQYTFAADRFQQTGREAAGMDAQPYRLKREELISLCGNGAVVAESNPNSSPLNNGLKDACPIVLEMEKARVPI